MIKRILDLFSGTQSVRKALTDLYSITEWKYESGIWKGWVDSSSKHIIEYIGIDIYSPEGQNTHFDLTQSNVVKQLLLTLPPKWTPDFIWASPVCNKFSCATTGKPSTNKKIYSGNYYFEVNKSTGELKIRDDWDFKRQPHMEKYNNPEGIMKAKEEAQLALDMYENTISIIDHFQDNHNVPFAIENPRSAFSKYVLKDYVQNYTAYCMWGFGYQKRTTIYSNQMIELANCVHKKHELSMSYNVGKYKDRARVPKKLIIKVIKTLLQ